MKPVATELVDLSKFPHCPLVDVASSQNLPIKTSLVPIDQDPKMRQINISTCFRS
jgi:hypothetical protein